MTDTVSAAPTLSSVEYLLAVYAGYVLYVQEVVTLQKKMLNIFASENEVYNIY